MIQRHMKWTYRFVLLVISWSYSSWSCWSLWGIYSLHTRRASLHISVSWNDIKYSLTQCKQRQYKLCIVKQFYIPQPLLYLLCGSGSSQSSTTHINMHIKYSYLLIRKSSLWNGGSGFPRWLSEWSLKICPIKYNHKLNLFFF